MPTTQEKQMRKSIKNLLFCDKYPDDREVLARINELATAAPGIKPKDAVKNFLLRTLPQEIKRLRETSGQLLGGN